MSLYFEYPVNFKESGVISTCGLWHSTYPLLAVASYSQERGGFVTIFDELGEPLQNVVSPVHPVSQVTTLVWHPERKILVTGWENGEIKIWNGADKDFYNVQGLHQAPIILLKFSEKGGRLASCDSTGSLVGWKIDSKGDATTVFHHDLKETVTHLIFRAIRKSYPDVDIEGLAKAAVNGDEAALDIFSNWRPKTTAKKFRVQDGLDNYCFFVATHSGSIFYVNASGDCIEVLNIGGTTVNYLLYHPLKDALVLMMEGFTIGQFSVDSNGKLTEISKIKLSGRLHSTRGISDQGLIFAGNSCLAILTGDLNIRMWDTETNDNYILPVTMNLVSKESESSQDVRENFTCIAYSNVNHTICAGTNAGKIYFWTKRQRKNDVSLTPEGTWELTNISNISGTIKQLMWGSVNLTIPLVTVNCVTKVYIMKEQTLCANFCDKIWATQQSANQVLLETQDSRGVVQTDLQVTCMCLSEEYLAVTNGHNISVYNISIKNGSRPEIATSFINSFRCTNESIELYSKNIVVLTITLVKIFTVHGINVTNISSTTSEGEPIGINVTNNFLTVFTLDGVLKLYDLSLKEPKLITPPCNFFDICDDFGEIIQAKSNCVGTKVALTLAASNLIPDGKLYVWDLELTKLMSFDCRNCEKTTSYSDGDGQGDSQEKSATPEIEYSVRDDNNTEFEKIWSQRVPLSLHWDHEDAKLLVCNARKYTNERKKFISLYTDMKKNETKIDFENEDHLLLTFFVSSDHGIHIHDIRAIDSDARLLGVAAPFIALLENLIIVRKVMTDFNGLENCTSETKEAILDFSYNISHGNMDAAFKSIKLVQSQGVWNSLARMCVKTKRLDVATVCLGHMGDARAAGALRVVMEDSNLPLEAKVAALAVELGMLEEAEHLYRQCNRYDLLNKFYQRQNMWLEALEVARTKDRIHYKNTEHRYAKYLEQMGNIKEAIIHYEKANTHRSEVPRILLEEPRELEAYILNSNDKELLKWWGQYSESQGDIKTALKYYERAEDLYNQVRGLCLIGEEERAFELARSGSDKAAFYHMARYYETHNDLKKAISFYTRATAFSNAVRLCRETNNMEELWSIGLISNNREKINCARFFEDSGHLDKAVILYHRAGVLHKALDLAFKSHQFDTIQGIATDLDTESDPALIEKCADYFVQNEQYDKAVDLLAVGKKYEDAIKICLQYNVQLSDDLVEKLTPEKGTLDENTRVHILDSLAESLMMQGSYHLATKKFTQAGNRLQAMKALLKSGDTEKITFFATVSRQKEIYIMAANYLQSLDWQNNPDILKNIITFYSKGKASDLLANFYVACAQVEIDEFQNYDKAFGALTEASRCLSKTVSPKDLNQHRKAMEIVQKRMTDIKRFLDIKKMFENGDFQQGMTQCRQLLTTRDADLEESVRRGDVYALMMQYNITNGNFIEAQELLNELQHILNMSNSLPITYYVNKEMIEALARGLSVSPSSLLPHYRKKAPKEHFHQDLAVNEDVED
ncbi:intraflagellar transport protein 140 homolog [Agrilus planipennis]|uniref:Intraflagellar transport protein 140 homolog n=1 Tax=Agrilus planipennis TaxID=224129 RepID=A0A1W4XS70_AGRPL|nr:intraflagellar transport protein 140 homolog [Agrilus planipennis]